jgi:cytochrome c553
MRVPRVRLWSLGAAVGALALLPPAAGAQAKKQPVYVGARACAACHEGKQTGNQYSHWLLSKHARAWAELAKPEAKEMARLSGITDVP